MKEVGLLGDGLLASIVFASAASVAVAKVHRRWEDRTVDVRAAAWPWVALFAVTAVALVALPFKASRMAETATGWSDVNGDGMLDGFANGDYDWLGVNGGSLARYWFLGLLLVAAASGVVGVWLERRDRAADAAT